MSDIQAGQIRVNVSTLTEIAGKAASQVTGVESSFEALLRQARVMVGGELKQAQDRIALEEKGVILFLTLKLAGDSCFVEVAREVQRRVRKAIQEELGLLLHRINVEIHEIEWL